MLLSMTVTTVTKIFKIIARQYHPAKYLHINGLVYILYIYITYILGNQRKNKNKYLSIHYHQQVIFLL